MPLLLVNSVIMLVLEVPLLFILRYGFHLGIVPIATTIAITNAFAFVVTYVLFKMGLWKKQINIH